MNTDVIRQALEEAKELTAMCAGEYQGLSDGLLNHAQNTAGATLQALAALDAMQSVDLEALIEEYSFKVYPNATDLSNDTPFARALRDMHQRGLLGIPEGYALVEKEKLLDLAMNYGQIDGSHHKQWCLDQIVRLVTGDEYEQTVKEYMDGEDGPETYGYDKGIAP